MSLVHLGNQLACEGISGDNVVNSGAIDWFDYRLPCVIYGNADIHGTYFNRAATWSPRCR